MKKNALGSNILLFSLFLALPAQGSSNSSVSEESLDAHQGGVKASILEANVKEDNAQPVDYEDWEPKARELQLWSLQRELFKQGKISSATYKSSFETK